MDIPLSRPLIYIDLEIYILDIIADQSYEILANQTTDLLYQFNQLNETMKEELLQNQTSFLAELNFTNELDFFEIAQN
jgi:hypothetical protein